MLSAQTAHVPPEQLANVTNAKRAEPQLSERNMQASFYLCVGEGEYQLVPFFVVFSFDMPVERSDELTTTFSMTGGVLVKDD